MPAMEAQVQLLTVSHPENLMKSDIFQPEQDWLGWQTPTALGNIIATTATTACCFAP